MQIEIEANEGFSLYIDFEKSEGDPSRVFHAMGALVDSFATLDQELIGIIGERLETEMVLDEITTGSLRSRLRSILLAIPDEAISEVDLKKLIGHYLVKAKYKIVDWLSKNEKIENIEQVRVLEGELITLAEQTGVKHIPAYNPINTRKLLSEINSIQLSIQVLDPKDTVRYESPYGNVEIPRSLHVNEILIREILTRETIVSEDIRIVKVKKPDYLGKSKWVLKYAGHSIEAAIDDQEWLFKFQNNIVSLQPGDSLRVLMRVEVSYGYNLEVVHFSHSVIQVLNIIPPAIFDQTSFDL
jgi:hypothetical protein